MKVVIASRIWHGDLLGKVNVTQRRKVHRRPLGPSIDAPSDIEPWEVAAAGDEVADGAD